MRRFPSALAALTAALLAVVSVLVAATPAQAAPRKVAAILTFSPQATAAMTGGGVSFYAVSPAVASITSPRDPATGQATGLRVGLPGVQARPGGPIVLKGGFGLSAPTATDAETVHLFLLRPRITVDGATRTGVVSARVASTDPTVDGRTVAFLELTDVRATRKRLTADVRLATSPADVAAALNAILGTGAFTKGMPLGTLSCTFPKIEWTGGLD